VIGALEIFEAVLNSSQHSRSYLSAFDTKWSGFVVSRLTRLVDMMVLGRRGLDRCQKCFTAVERGIRIPCKATLLQINTCNQLAFKFKVQFKTLV